MKYLKLTLLLAFVFFIFEKSFAQSLGIYGNIESFTIDYSHLSGGQNILKLNTGTTPIKYKVSLTRSTDPTGGAWAYYPVDIIIGLGYLKDGKYLFFDGQYNFKSTDFSQYQSNLEKELIAQVDPSKLAASDKIYLVYEYHKPGFPSSSWRTEKFPVNTAGYGYVLPVTTFYNVAKSEVFFKDNCPPGNEPAPYTHTIYSVPAGKYSSTISQADADAKAQAEIIANGQNKANSEQLCVDFGIVKSPNGSMDINHYDYVTEIKWNKLSFSGANVKIELYSSDELSLAREIISSTPNTGSLKNATVAPMNSAQDGYKIKITSLDTGTSYFSGIFYIRQD